MVKRELSPEELKEISCQQLASVLVSLPQRYPEIYERIQKIRQKEQASK